MTNIHDKLAKQEAVQKVCVSLTLDKGGLWGQGLKVYEWVAYSPSRGNICHYSAIFMPGDESRESANRVGHDHILDKDNFLVELSHHYRLEIVIGHHEGCATETLQELEETYAMVVEQDAADALSYSYSAASIEECAQIQRGMAESIRVIKSLINKFPEMEVGQEVWL